MHAEQPTVADRPGVANAQMNGLDTIRFGNGAPTSLILPGLSGLSAASIFAVVQNVADPAASQTYSGFWNFGSLTEGTHHPYTDGKIYEGFGSTTRKTLGDPSIPLDSPHLYSVESEDGNWVARINAAEFFSTVSNTAGFAAECHVGRNDPNSGRFYDGHFAEIVVLDHVPSQTDREIIEGYLAHKWGTEGSLPTNHPYRYQAPTVAAGIAGVIKDANGNPCQRAVYIITRPTDGSKPTVVEHGLSDPITGEYDMAVPAAGEYSRVVISEDDDPLLNDIIDRVISG